MSTGASSTPNGLAFKPAVEILNMFCRRELKPSEYLELMLQRIDNDADTALPINAFTEIFAEDARAEAAGADEHYAHADGPDPDRPLIGLPIVTKEKHNIRGRLYSQGMRAYADDIAEINHPVIERLQAAGGIIHGRTTSPEFSCATFTHTQLWGVTRNPWNRELSPGGSSGGASAALAAGFAPLATASDIAGSTRLPAGFAGVVGYKGPYGTVPGTGPFAADWYRGDGAMARSTADVALLHNVMRGPHVSDHGSIPSPKVLVGAIAKDTADLKGRRIVYAPTLGNYPVQRSVRRTLDAAVARLESAGADIVEVQLPWTTEHILRTTMAHFGHLLAEGMRRQLAGREDTAEDYTLKFIEVAQHYAGQLNLFDTLENEHRIQAELLAALGDADALVTPVSAVKALKADGTYLDGITLDDQPDGGTVHLEHYWEAHMTVPFNINNRCPVLSIPAGLDDGFPIGMQIVGKPFDETTVFELGAAWEQLSHPADAEPIKIPA